MKLVLGMFALWLADIWDQWYYAHDIDYIEGELLRPKWVQWGTCKPYRPNPAHEFRYFVLRLPSWVWFDESMCGDWMRPQWMQRGLLRFAGRWRTTHFECLS